MVNVTDNSNKILIIVPAYNEEHNIENTVEQIKQVKNMDYIVINDGSTDSTLDILINKNYNYVNLPTNLGIGAAVQTGYKYALQNKYDIAIQFDGDGQHNIQYINNLISEIEKGNDLVVGSRFLNSEEGFKSTAVRRIGIKILSFLIKIFTKKSITDPTSGFRACNRKIIEIFSREYPIDYPEPDTIVKLLKLQYTVKEIPVIMNERKTGKSSISPIKSIYYMIKVSFSIIIAGVSSKGDKQNVHKS